MNELRFGLATLAEPPTPPSGSVYDHLVNCTTYHEAIYGSKYGDTSSIKFAAQKMVTSTSEITGFGIQIARHGIPSEPLYIGLTRDSLPSNPFNVSSYVFFDGIEASALPLADTSYWVQAQINLTNTILSPVYVIALTDADFNDTSFWAWETCSSVSSGENLMNIYGAV